MWDLDYKESWEPKNWCFRTVVLEKTPESLLDCKEIKPVNPKGNQSWIFIERTSAEAETLILWPPDVKDWLTGKDSEAGKDWGEGDDRGWDGWMASPTRWTWAWVGSGSWWWTGKPGMLQSMGSQSQTQLSEWTELTCIKPHLSQVVPNHIFCKDTREFVGKKRTHKVHSRDLGYFWTKKRTHKGVWHYHRKQEEQIK